MKTIIETGGIEPFLVYARRDSSVSFMGDLDMGTSAMFGSVIQRMLEEETTAVLTLNLRGILFADSTGLREILRAHSSSLETGKKLEIHPSPSLIKVMSIGGILDKLHIIDEIKER